MTAINILFVLFIHSKKHKAGTVFDQPTSESQGRIFLGPVIIIIIQSDWAIKNQLALNLDLGTS